ncbi:arabinogalactan oligomer/maltooligosaccharide transport system substrate-binding protein [Paenibacillus sp. DS2015]|uniref:sugar ABC transporter substrate-binding protein n=1 Tax=Paenibacillus sp. DS2015 TaxID=3373917 RepID=UPI003D1D7FCA
MIQKEKEIVIWHEFDGPGDTSIEVLEEICALYSERNHIKVTTKVMSLHELTQKVREVGTTGVSPHMIMVPEDMATYAEKGCYSEMDRNLFKDVLSEDMRSTMQYNGVQYGVPILTGNHLVLYYNKEIMEKAPQSWDDIERLADALKSNNIIPIGADFNQSYWFIPILSAFGGWPIKDDKPSVDTKEMKNAMQFVRNKLDENIVVSLDASTELLEQFMEGKIGAIITGEWNYNYLNQHMGERLGVGRLPDIQGNHSIAMTSSIGLFYLNHSLESEYREDLLSFTAFMLSEECQLKWANQVQRIPASQRVLESLSTTSSPNNKEILSLIQYNRPLPIHDSMFALWIALDYGLDLLIKGYSIPDSINQIVEKLGHLNVEPAEKVST